MLEIIYRIYEVADEETAIKNLASNKDFGLFSSTSKGQNIELLMDCCICESRDEFKDIIRSQYGEDISFRYSKKLDPGELYCIIIGEHCYNPERYFNKIQFCCDFCHAEVETYFGKPISFSDYEISTDLYNIQDYRNKRFCSNKCKQDFLKLEKSHINPGDDDHFYVTRDSFTQQVAGYIYKITKKSTGQFYVGQTIYAPIFRWGEHLHTERFPIECITDYKFEVIEIVPIGKNILEREKYWIQTLYKENPDLSLNIACTKGVI